MSKIKIKEIDEITWDYDSGFVKYIDLEVNERRATLYFDYRRRTAILSFDGTEHKLYYDFGSDSAKKLARRLRKAGIEEFLKDALEETVEWTITNTMYRGNYDLDYIIKENNVRFVVEDGEWRLTYDVKEELEDSLFIVDVCELLATGELAFYGSDNIPKLLIEELHERGYFDYSAPVKLIGPNHFSIYLELIEERDSDKIDISDAVIYLEPDEVDEDMVKRIAEFMDEVEIHIRAKDKVYIPVKYLTEFWIDELQTMLGEHPVIDFIELLKDEGMKRLYLSADEEIEDDTDKFIALVRTLK